MRLHGVGVDVASVDRIARLIDAHGETFTSRWFTRLERTRCAARAEPARAFAEAFAAKEAAWKALSPAGWDGSVPWRWIGIVAERGRGTARLSGPVALATPAGVRVEVSVSSTLRIATAFATARLPAVRPR